MTTTRRLLETSRNGTTLVVSPLTDLAELDYSQIDDEAANVLRLFELTRIDSVVINLEHVDYSGSSAISFFLKLWQEVNRRGGRMAVCHVSPHELEILKACNLDRLWRRCESVDEALAAVSGDDNSGDNSGDDNIGDDETI